jgi:kynurenine formamidase
MKPFPALACAVSLCAVASASALDLGGQRMIDLSHAFDERTLYWPSKPPMKFEMEQLAYGRTAGGFFYSSNRVCTPEHGGTHLDAPIHFHEGGQTTAQLPLERLIAAGVRIDVTRKALENRDYRLTRQDVESFEAEFGRIPAGAIVLLHTGWSRHWPDRKRYLGDASADDASGLSFPSYGEDAARLLVEERGVAMLGIDTASIDYGRSKDFIVHRVTAARGVGGLENLTDLEKLPEAGFTVIALPMKIAGGSGGPARVVALIGK